MTCKPFTLSHALFFSWVLGSLAALGTPIALYDFERQDFSSSDTLSTGGDLTSAIGGMQLADINTQHTHRQTPSDPLTFASPLSGFALTGSYGDIRQSADLQFAINNNRYLGFVVTPPSGGQILLNQFRITIGNTNGGAAKLVGLYSSVQGFSSTANQIGANLSLAANATNSAEEGILDISGEAPITAPTEFRVYLVTNASTGSHGVAVDNITLDGSLVVIPEPGTLALTGLGLLLATALRRRSAR